MPTTSAVIHPVLKIILTTMYKDDTCVSNVFYSVLVYACLFYFIGSDISCHMLFLFLFVDNVTSGRNDSLQNASMYFFKTHKHTRTHAHTQRYTQQQQQQQIFFIPTSIRSSFLTHEEKTTKQKTYSNVNFSTTMKANFKDSACKKKNIFM